MTHNVPQVQLDITYVMFQIYFFERIPGFYNPGNTLCASAQVGVKQRKTSACVVTGLWPQDDRGGHARVGIE